MSAGVNSLKSISKKFQTSVHYHQNPCGRPALAAAVRDNPVHGRYLHAAQSYMWSEIDLKFVVSKWKLCILIWKIRLLNVTVYFAFWFIWKLCDVSECWAINFMETREASWNIFKIWVKIELYFPPWNSMYHDLFIQRLEDLSATLTQFAHSKRRLERINSFLLIRLLKDLKPKVRNWFVLDQLLSLNLLTHDVEHPKKPFSSLKKKKYWN